MKNTSTHIIKLPYGGNIAHVWRNIERNYYSIGIFNPKKIRRLGGHYYKFTTWNQVKEHIRYCIKTHFDRESLKAADRAAAQALVPGILATYAEGDILECSWGYEQTNVEFVQVTGKTASRLIVRAISGNLRYTQSMAGMLKAEKNSFVGPAFYLNVRPYGTDGGHCVRGSYVYDKGKVDSANHWSKTSEKQEHYCSWYA